MTAPGGTSEHPKGVSITPPVLLTATRYELYHHYYIIKIELLHHPYGWYKTMLFTPSDYFTPERCTTPTPDGYYTPERCTTPTPDGYYTPKAEGLWAVWRNKWLLASIFGFNHNNDTCIPAGLGYLEAFKSYSTLKYDMPYIRAALNRAALNGYFDIVKWLYTRHCGAKGFEFTIDCAVMGGELEIIKWLDLNGAGCTSQAMDRAASCGHFDVVKWLYTFKLSAGCSTDAMDDACTYGYFDIVKFLYSHRNELYPDGVWCTDDALDGACRNGHLPIVKWLYSVKDVLFDCILDPMRYAAQNGHLAVVEWLHSFLDEDVRGIDIGDMIAYITDVFYRVCEYGHLSVAKFLYFHYGEEYINDDDIHAAMSYCTSDDRGDDVVEWLSTLLDH